MMKRHLPAGDARDDADVRGEHDYVPPRSETPESTTQQILRQRQAGHYAAGADGTQSVPPPEQPKTERPKQPET